MACSILELSFFLTSLQNFMAKLQVFPVQKPLCFLGQVDVSWCQMGKLPKCSLGGARKSLNMGLAAGSPMRPPHMCMGACTCKGRLPTPTPAPMAGVAAPPPLRRWFRRRFPATFSGGRWHGIGFVGVMPTHSMAFSAQCFARQMVFVSPSASRKLVDDGN